MELIIVNQESDVNKEKIYLKMTNGKDGDVNIYSSKNGGEWILEAWFTPNGTKRISHHSEDNFRT